MLLAERRSDGHPIRTMIPEIALVSYSATFIRLLGEPSTGSKQLLRIVLMVF